MHYFKYTEEFITCMPSMSALGVAGQPAARANQRQPQP